MPTVSTFPKGHSSTSRESANGQRMPGSTSSSTAPGAQQKYQPFTGKYSPNAGFYVDWQYERTYKWLEWMTNIIHTNTNFAQAGTIQLVNEPSRMGTPRGA